MWIFKCDSDALEGKEHWLKPGAVYTIGRSKISTVDFMVAQRSVSRSHLVIRVGEVPEGDGLRIHARSTVTLQGLETKWGSKLDGEEIADGETKTLTGTEHVLHLGKYEPAFRIYWKPFILSFSLTSKEKKDKVMLGRQAKAEKHDIKTVETYVYTTTHVVASKRNTALGLQGLVNGKYIVTEDFLDAVVKVAEAGDGEARCPLEEDFDAHWPKPLDYIPPAGNEPNPREPELFLPDERRQNLFEGCTIIFCEKLQYETFLGPITDGHGKLERFDLDPGKTTARELVNFVEKRSSGSGITTLVKLRPGKGNDPEWCAQLNSTVQEMLGYHLPEQNQFLDIILLRDISSLRKLLRAASPLAGSAVTQSDITAAKDTKMGPPPQRPSEDVPMADAAVERKPRRLFGGRLATRPKFELESLFSGDPLPIPDSSLSTSYAVAEPSQFIPSTTQQTQSVPGSSYRTTQVTFADEDVTAGPSQYDLNTQKSSMSRKRSLREEKEGEDDPDAMDTLFPGAAAMKRRKLQQELENSLKLPEVPSERSPPESLETESAKPAVKGKKGKKENPFLVAARANLEEEEEEERKKFQDLNLNDEELEMIKFIRNPGIVEVVGIRSRETPRAEAHGDEGSRWNPKWNGRANFKRFKRAGASAAMRTVRGAVIVGLVEHKSQADRVFMEGDKMATQRTQARDTQLSRGRGGGSPPLANDSDSEDSLEEITAPVRAGRRLASESSQTISGSSNTTRAASVVTGKGKRTVASNSNSAAEKEPKAKRQRTFLLKHDSSDSSEDELKFRFKRK